MDLADVFTAPAPPPATDPWGGPVPTATAIPTAAPVSDPWGGPPVPPAADPWGGPATTPASGDPWRPAAPAGPPVDPWGGTQAPAAGEGPTPDPWGSSEGEYTLAARACMCSVTLGWATGSCRGRSQASHSRPLTWLGAFAVASWWPQGQGFAQKAGMCAKAWQCERPWLEGGDKVGEASWAWAETPGCLTFGAWVGF